MDSQNRLTRFDEWIPGRHYQWTKHRCQGDTYRCESVNPKLKTVLLFSLSRKHLVTYTPRCWKNRFIEVPNPCST